MFTHQCLAMYHLPETSGEYSPLAALPSRPLEQQSRHSILAQLLPSKTPPYGVACLLKVSSSRNTAGMFLYQDEFTFPLLKNSGHETAMIDAASRRIHQQNILCCFGGFVPRRRMERPPLPCANPRIFLWR